MKIKKYEVLKMKLEFVKDEENYEVRVVNSDDYEVAGELVKDENGTWCFNYKDQSVAYDADLEETEDNLRDEFENGKNDSMTYSFGNYSYKK